MELKIKYQYTYFIHPFVIPEGKYKKYILKLLKDKKCKLKVFQKEKDIRLYKYFLPNIKDFLFSSFSFTNSKINKFEELPMETRAAVLTKYPCTIFEYTIENDIHGKTGEEKGIFFKLRNIEIICFNSGICFLCMKTNIENTNNFGDILNFNYKFRDINQENAILNNYDNIRLQTDSFSEINRFSEFVKSITGNNIENNDHDLNSERFLTYSYVCIDQEAWNNENNFENINHNFIKFANILSADNNMNFEHDQITTISRWKFAKLGLIKSGATLFTSSAEMNNYTVLPEEFEKEYFYTYIVNLYKKIYLKRINLKFKKSKNLGNIRREFVNFTKNIWIQEVTEDDTGSIINDEISKTLGLNALYAEVKNKYDLLYKELNINKKAISILVVLFILLISLILNIIGFSNLI